MIGDGLGGGDQLAATMTASGYAITQMLLDGLNREAGWFYLILASISLAYAAFLSLSAPGGLGLFIRHVIAVCIASFLLYVPIRIDLSSVMTHYANSDKNLGTQGAAPIPAYIVDRIGTTLVGSVKTLIAGQDKIILPELEEAFGEMTRDGSVLKDQQAQANAAIWRQVVGPALLNNTPQMARDLRDAHLTDRFLNPTSSSQDWVSKSMAAESEKVTQIIKHYQPNLASAVCETQPMINEIKGHYQAQGWVVPGGCEQTEQSSPVVVPNYDSDSQSAIDALAILPLPNDSVLSVGRANLLDWDHQLKPLVESDQNQNAAELYGHIGNSLLYAAVTGAAHPSQNLGVLGALCINKGESCKRQNAGIYSAAQTRASAVADTQDEGVFNSIWTVLKGGISALVLAVVSAILGILASFISGLTPYLIGVARAVTLILSIIGVYMLLIPGRYGRSIEWMIAPLIWVNLWDCFYIIWWKVSEILSSFSWTMGKGSLDSMGGINAGLVLHLVSSLGYLSLPALAWHVVFSGSGGALRGIGTATVEKHFSNAGAQASKAGVKAGRHVSNKIAQKKNDAAHQSS